MDVVITMKDVEMSKVDLSNISGDTKFLCPCGETFTSEIDFIHHVPCPLAHGAVLQENVDDFTEKLVDAASILDLVKEIVPNVSAFQNNVFEALFDSDYKHLRRVLDAAMVQSARGKGTERHNKGNSPFDEQQIVHFGKRMRTTAYNIGQACKKAEESMGLPPQAAIKELLGAINYLAGAVIILEMLNGDELVNDAFYEKGDY